MPKYRPAFQEWKDFYNNEFLYDYLDNVFEYDYDSSILYREYLEEKTIMAKKALGVYYENTETIS
jgi:hypothetical protein